MERISGHLRDGESHIVDLCTGSGCVALLLARLRREVSIVGCDVDPICVRLAHRNRARVLPATEHSRVSFVQADVMSAELGRLLQGADAVLANPPYIDEADEVDISLSTRRWEPRKALVAAMRGDAIIERIIDVAEATKSIQLVAIEVSGAQQADRIAQRSARVWASTIWPDSAGVDRCVVLRRLATSSKQR